jgi:hypothetical protein
MRAPSLIIACLCLPAPAVAHHSAAAWFDGSRTIEIEGVLTDIRWQNPHVEMTIRADTDAGDGQTWLLETYSVSGIGRWGVSREQFSIGDRIRAAGNPARRGERRVWLMNLLLPSGEELLFGRHDPRWSGRAVRAGESLAAEEGDGSRPELGIFRVWSTGRGSPFLLPQALDANFDFSRYPLTDSARAARAAFDIFEDDPAADCMPKGMPAIMEQPYPMEFVERDGIIELHIEEYDLTRKIFTTARATARERAPSPLGYSVGRWDGEDLVVTTTRLNWGRFDTVGTPLSHDAVIVERFAPSADGARLDYTMTVADAATFTEPVVLEKFWIWRPEIVVQPFECTVTP